MVKNNFNVCNTIGIIILATFILFLVNVLTTEVGVTTVILGAGAFVAGLSTFLTFSHIEKARLYASFFFLLIGIYATFRIIETTTTIFTITMLALVVVGFLFLFSEKPGKKRASFSVNKKTIRRKTSARKKITKRRAPKRKTKRRR